MAQVEQRRETGTGLIDGGGDAEVAQLRHREPAVAAGVDVGEG